MATELVNTDNAPNILFRQARRPDLVDRPRFMVPEGEDWRPVSWGETSRRVQGLASFLIDRGVDLEVKVAVMADTRLEWALAGMAVLAARGTLVPVYPTLLGESLAHTIGHSDSRVLFVETAEHLKRVLAVWNKIEVETLVTIEPLDVRAHAAEAGLDPDALASCTFPLQQAETLGATQLDREPNRVLDRTAAIELDDVGYLVYTSGTTGLPKGVMLSHRNVGINGADWVQVNEPLIEESFVDILWLPMSHLFGWGEYCLGNQLVFQTYLSHPLKALPHMAQHRPHVFMSVPIYWEKMMQLAQASSDDEEQQLAALRKLTGGRLRFLLSGGAGLRREVKEFFHKAGLLIVEGYGLTECSPTLTMNRHDDFDFSSVGKPFPNVTLKLAEDGEILTKGPNVFRGYYKDPAATAAMFDADGWMHTGDLGRFNENGFLQIIGRKKEILVTAGGKNVPPENIEMRFRDEPLIAQMVVYGDGKKYLTALVDIDELVARARLEEAGEAPGTSLRRHPKIVEWVQQAVDTVNTDLAKYETIKKFAVADEALTMENGLLTPSLKVKRKKVYERFGKQLEALYQ